MPRLVSKEPYFIQYVAGFNTNFTDVEIYFTVDDEVELGGQIS